MTGAAVSIRPATTGDLDALVAIHEAAARTGYRHIFPADAPFPHDESRSDLHRYLTSPDRHVFVAETGDRAVGFVATGETLPGDGDGLGDAPPGSLGQIYLLHVDPVYWGGGIGGALHERAITALAADGIGLGILWVIERNDCARRFYEQRGWRADGVRRRERYAIEIDVIRYRRALP